MNATSHGLLPQLVLIVAGDRAARQMFRQFLVPRGFVVEEAGNGSEALAKAISDPPDVIVTERDLPGFSGDQLCRMLKEDRDTRRVPIVLLADGPAGGEDVADSVADATLAKPCPPDRLLTEIKLVRDRSADLRDRARPARSAARRLVRRSSNVFEARVLLAGDRSNEQY
jgi:DNA-binding response OmpR family regulator